MRIINTEYWYTDDNINTYVNNFIEYNLGGFKDHHSFLLRDKRSENNDFYYIVYAGAIDSYQEVISLGFFLDKTTQQSPDQGKADDRKDVFDELLPVMMLDTYCRVKILFPYNITNIHWLTGEIILVKNGNNLSIEVYTHDPYGVGKLSEDNFEIIKNAINNRLKESDLGITSFKNLSSKYTKPRQDKSDSTSCGVIVAEEIIKRIQGQELDEKFPEGTSLLRQKQLNYLHDHLGEQDKVFKIFEQQVTLENKISKQKSKQPKLTEFYAKTSVIDKKNSNQDEKTSLQNHHERSIVTSSKQEDIDTRLNPKKFEFTADGLKHTLHGVDYQLQLLILVALRAVNNNSKEFVIISEAKEFEKFDDLVIDYGNRILFLQAKHRDVNTKENENYSKKDFCSNRGDANLAKYFDSWYRLKESRYCKTEDSNQKVTQYVFFTNRGIKQSNSFLIRFDAKIEELIFTDSNNNSGLINNNTFTFKIGDTRKEFIDAIIEYSKEVNKDNSNNIDWDHYIKSGEINLIKSYLAEKTKKKSKTIEFPNTFTYKNKTLNKETIAIIKFVIDNKNNEIIEKIFPLEENAVLRDVLQKTEFTFKKEISTDCLRRIEISKENKKAQFEAFINQFLDEFIIKINQPDVPELHQIIIEEAQKNTEISGNELANTFYLQMYKWLTDKATCIMTSNNFNNITKRSKNDFYRLYFWKTTNKFKKEFDNKYKGISDLTILELEEFLKVNNKSSIAVIKDQGGGVKQRVHNTIKKLDNLNYDTKWIFCNIHKILIEELKLIPLVLQGETTKFLIIDCTSADLADLNEQVQSIVNSTITNSKKLILLLKSDQSLADFSIDVGNAQEFYTSPLLDEQIEVIINSNHLDATVHFGLKQFKLINIYHKNSSIYELMKNLDFLNNLLNTQNKVQNTQNEEDDINKLIANIYIKNDLVEGIPQYSLRSILENVDAKIFIVQSETSDKSINFEWLNNKLESYFNNKPEGYTNNKRHGYICSDESASNEDLRYRLVSHCNALNECSEKLIYLIPKLQLDNLEDIYNLPNSVYISIVNSENEINEVVVEIEKSENSYRLPAIPLRYDFDKKSLLESSGQDELRDKIAVEMNFVILSANAGFGKSAYCRNMLNSWINNDDAENFQWLIYINLPKLQFKREDPELFDALTLPATDVEWSDWQFKILELDIQKNNQVRLLLDGFDEIKDEEQLSRFNKWIDKIPASVSVLITTRPYAANKIKLPEDRPLDLYVTLKEYNEIQHKEYISSYVKTICKYYKRSIQCDIREEAITAVANKIYDTLKSDVCANTEHLLGIPLESYIFCETLRSDILQWIKSGEEPEQFEIINEDNKSKLNTAKLYQKFTYAKLELFLHKHMQMSTDTTLKLHHHVYSFTVPYIDILTIFAFKQAFSYSYSFISDELRSKYYTSTIIDETVDIGVSSVTRDQNEINIGFHHETYQEYFAALFIYKALLSNGKAQQLVEEKIQEHRYDPKYRMIMIMLAQLSINNDPLIPGYNSSHDLKLFWNILFENGDILGAAAAKLFLDCTQSMTDEQTNSLENELKSINIRRLKHIAENFSDANTISVSIDNDIPLSLSQGSSQKNTELILLPETRNQRIKVLKDKNQVIKVTKALIDQQVDLYQTAIYFKEIIKQYFETEKNERYEILNHYWDIDGGFQAMAMLGNAFDKVLASYFIDRIENDPEWRVFKALDAIQTLCSNELIGEALEGCVEVICCLIKKKKYIQLKFNHTELISVLKYPELIFNELYCQVKEKLYFSLTKQNYIKLIDRYKDLLCEPVNIFMNILWCAYHLQYAVSLSEEKHTIHFIKDIKFSITLQDDKEIAFFKKIQENIFYEIEKSYDIEKVFKQIEKFQTKVEITGNVELIDRVIPDSLIFEIQEYILSDEKNIHVIFEQVRDDSNLTLLYKQLFNHNLINKSTANLLISELKSSKAIEKFNFWSINTGIKAIEYIGQYFNQEIADYLILRSKFWLNNKFAAINSLTKIYNALIQNYTYSKIYEAINAYNNCIKDNVFKSNYLDAQNKLEKYIYLFCDQSNEDKILVPLNIDDKNLSGLIIKFDSNTKVLEIYYIYYENYKIPEFIREKLEKGLDEKSGDYQIYKEDKILKQQININFIEEFNNLNQEIIQQNDDIYMQNLLLNSSLLSLSDVFTNE